MGFFASLRKLLFVAFEFLRDSLPDRRRARFGDTDYDWEHRVDTTSANVRWRARLLGLLNSAYQPIEPALFRQIMDSLDVDFRKFTFSNVARMYTSMNPDFFKGTAVEAAVASEVD